MENSQGKRLRNLREQHNASQKDFAIQIGYRQSHLSELENDKTTISVELLEILFNKFGYSPNFHIIGIGEMIIPKSEINIHNMDLLISEIHIQEQSVDYKTKSKIEQSEEKSKKLLEENWTLRSLVNKLKNEKEELNIRLLKTQEKIIALLERPVHENTNPSY